MCLFNANSKKAKELAEKYGRSSDVVEIYRKILEEKEEEERRLNNDQIKNIFSVRIAEEMYDIPAYSEPQCVIISESEQLQIMQWGLLPSTAKPADVEKYNKQNWFKNAHGERIFETWPFRNLIMHQRCLIPSTGFIEYHHFSEKDKQPFFVTIPSREVFCMAGLWDRWAIPGKGGTSDGGYDLDNPDFDKYIYTFTQITTDANDLMRMIHNGGNNPYRMPMILKPEDEQRWLDTKLTMEEVKGLIASYIDEPLFAIPISKKFRSINPYSNLVIEEAEASQVLVFPNINDFH